MLSIVATPIGNLEDITLRAIRTLKEADFILAEDTRHAKILLNKYEITTHVISFHAHTNDAQREKFIEMLKEGKNLALISDAGTPGISDPGYVLIRDAVAENIKIDVIPGPSAVITAVVASGLPANRFIYLGFLPLKKGRQTLLQSLAESEFTIVLYEAPHRIEKTLSQLLEFLGDREIAVCREMTKMFAEIFRGTTQQAIAHFKQKKPRGEFTLVIGPMNY